MTKDEQIKELRKALDEIANHPIACRNPEVLVDADSCAIMQAIAMRALTTMPKSEEKVWVCSSCEELCTTKMINKPIDYRCFKNENQILLTNWQLESEADDEV